MRRALDRLLVFAWAARCAACRQTLDHPTAGPVCRHCWSRIVPEPPSRPPVVPHLALARAAGRYDGALRAIVHAFKYHGHRTLAEPLARLLLHACGDALAGADVLVAVPLHPRRAWSRGFNQAVDLAARLPHPKVTALRRRRFEATQAGLGREARRQNVRDVFAPSRRLRLAMWLSRGPLGARLPSWISLWASRHWSVDGKVVVLVDDVMTTGATLEACARVLRACGAREVRAVTTAWVERQSP